ncbi:MAG: phospholipid carrier-dependent glycosyltransferase [Acidobacteriia bacterium]|nr:phospholipid carrier-dependent glycosyltransferase [Terriglobia bacterium]
MKRLAARFHPELALLILVAVLTRALALARPAATVFDEIHFGQYAASYFTHQFYFDLHPPLGQLLFAGWAWLFDAGTRPAVDGPATVLRLLAALAGIAIVALVYGVLRRLTGSRLAAFLAGLAIALDGAFVAQARFVLVDNFLIAFGLGAVYAALRWRGHPRAGWLILAGLMAGGAVSIKWTGLSALALVLVIVVREEFARARAGSRRSVELAVVVFLAALVYVAPFRIHFGLLTRSGTGDEFMPEDFQAALIGNPDYLPSAGPGFWTKFLELNQAMYEGNATLTATHPYGSRWYTWPAEARPIHYWDGPYRLADGRQGNIYLIGNPLVWWPASLSVIVAIVLLIRNWRALRKRSLLQALAFLILAYLLNWLPFAAIGRVMFLYHYLFAAIASVMILATLIGSALPEDPRWTRSPRHWAALGFIALSVGGFLFFSPLTYGWPMTPAQHDARVWLSGWR